MPRWKLYLIRIGRLLAHPRLWRFLLHARTRYVITWLVVIIATAIGLYATWTAFDNPKRADGNDGHTAIDFGGQYLMGRMLLEGHGRHLFSRDHHREVLNKAYPQHRGDPTAAKSDAESLLEALIRVGPEGERPISNRVAAFLSPLASADPFGAAAFILNERHMNISDVGGPLYPPVNAFLYAPLALLDAQPAYHLMQIINLFLAFLSGWGLTILSERRVWWPIAAGFVMLYPGYNGSITLGQNATLSLTVLVWGWVFISRGRPGVGGMIWGLLVFKPVWALTFFLVPLVTRRWRTCVAMVCTGGGLALVTLPLVGLQSWEDWRRVGAEAADTYKYDSNWIPLSRDLLSLPRRWFDFENTSVPERRDDQAMAIIGWTILGTVLTLTVLPTLLRRRQARATTGVASAYIMLGAFLGCFHFMYYDMLISALGVFLLYTDPWQYLKPFFFRGRPWVINRMIPTLTVVLMGAPPLLYQWMQMEAFNVPADTFCLILIWLWCGWLWLRSPGEATDAKLVTEQVMPTLSAINTPQLIQCPADIGRAHERLPD